MELGTRQHHFDHGNNVGVNNVGVDSPKAIFMQGSW
jgi:hypothetical protein